MEQKTINDLLVEVQQELKAPKGQTNKFGGYKYRSTEDIIEAVKPLLHSRGLHITITDEIVCLGERYYIIATASVCNSNGDAVASSGVAREELEQKGMSTAQITGSTSSYARKYALNGLLAIDDTKDDDANNTHGKEPITTPTPVAKVTPTVTNTVQAKDVKAPATNTDDKPKTAIQPNTNFDAKDDSSERKAKAKELFAALDQASVLKYVIGTLKKKHTTVQAFIDNEPIELILDTYTKLTAK